MQVQSFDALDRHILKAEPGKTNLECRTSMKNMAESFGLGWAPVGVKVRRLFKGGIEMKVLETVPEFRAGANDAPIHNVPSYNALSNARPRYSQIGSLNHSIASFGRLMPSAGSARAVSKGTPPPSIG